MHTIRLLREGQLIAEAQTGSSDTAYNAEMAADLMQDGSDDWEILDEAGKRVTSKTDWGARLGAPAESGRASFGFLRVP